jgi:hypothetical protein
MITPREILRQYNIFILYICIPGEGNGSPRQYSCLGNPMDRGAWWGPWGRKKSDLATERAYTLQSIILLVGIPMLEKSLHNFLKNMHFQGCLL